VLQVSFQCADGNEVNASRSSAASRSMVSTFHRLAPEHPGDHFELFAHVRGVRWAKIVRIAAATISAEH